MKRSTNTDPLKSKLAAHLAAGGTIAQFARDNPARSERTYQDWSKSAEVREQVRKLLSEATETIRRRITAASVNAVTVLARLLSSQNESIQLGAAKAIVDRNLAIQEAADFENRLAQMEERPPDAKS